MWHVFWIAAKIVGLLAACLGIYSFLSILCGLPRLEPCPSSPHVMIDTGASMVNPSGKDNPGDEYVCIVNLEDRRVGMNGWELSDAGHQNTYTFSHFSLAPQQYVRLHSGAGADSQTDLYWGKGTAVWDNNGDAVLLVDDSGHRIDMRSYSEREDGVTYGECGASVTP